MVKNKHIFLHDLSTEDEDFKLWMLIVNMRRAMLKAREQELAQYGITPEQAGVLFAIKNIGRDATPTKIAKLTIRESHSASTIIDRMKKGGLVKKAKDLNNKKHVRISITRKGEQVYKYTFNRESIHYIMSCLSKKERGIFESCAMKLQDKAMNLINK